MSYTKSHGEAQAQDYYNTASATQQKLDGTMSQRIRVLADESRSHEGRLRAVLRNLRVPPPEPVISGIGSSGLNAVHTTIEEYLQRQESAHSNIEALISELEGLLA